MKFWKTREEIKAELLEELKEAARVEREEEERIKREAEEAARKKLEAEENARREAEEELRNSDEPWVVVRAAVPDPQHGVKLELDWNDAFVKYLRDSGIAGTSDDVIVQKYIALLSRDIAQQMADESQSSEYE